MIYEFKIHQGEISKAPIEVILNDQELKHELKNLETFLNLRIGTNESVEEINCDEKSVTIKITSAKAKNEVETELNKHLIEYNNVPNQYGFKKSLNLTLEKDNL